jgi:hypothetical protein
MSVQDGLPLSHPRREPFKLLPSPLAIPRWEDWQV